MEETMTFNTTEFPEQDFILGTLRSGRQEYSTASQYVDGQLVTYNNNVYAAVSPINGPPSGSASSNASWTYLYGTYLASHHYSPGDQITYKNRLYTANVSTIGSAPSGTSSSIYQWSYSGNGPSVSGFLGFYSDVSTSPIGDALQQQYYSLFARLTPMIQGLER
jgi:hypothetical protein